LNHIERIKAEITQIRPHGEDDYEWFDEGIVLLSAGRLDEVERKFKELMVSQPDHSDGYEGLALTIERQGELEKAVVFMTEAVRLSQVFLDNDEMDAELMNEMRATLRRMEEGVALRRAP